MDNILAQMRAILITTPERWQRLVEVLPVALLQRPAAPGEWSALECLQHMVETERVFGDRLRCFLENRDFPDFVPGHKGEELMDASDPTALIARFTELREQSLQSLSAITEADLERTAHHNRLGTVQLHQMLHQWAAHDLSHTVQAEEAIMQPLIAGCGPWQTFFQAHVVPS